MNKCLVLLSTYNGERYINELMDSVIAQENVQIDILIRDDGSTDGTLSILHRYENDYINVYRGNNLRPAKSFLDLIFHSSDQYDYYALCDQDDVWKKDKICSAIKCIRDINGPVLYSSAVDVTDANLNLIRKSITNNTFKSPLYDILMYGTPGCTFVFNKDLMLELKKYKPTTISMHDSWISFVCLAVGGKFYSDKNSYILYRQHGSNVLGAQRHSLWTTMMNIVNYTGVLRSDMAKELLKGYGNYMSTDIKSAFETFANYKENIKYKMKLLGVKYCDGGTSRRAFRKIKLRILFDSL